MDYERFLSIVTQWAHVDTRVITRQSFRGRSR
jgi:hypothetical protein